MTVSKKILKRKLLKDLTELAPTSVNKMVSERVGCTSENVRLWFKTPSRKNAQIEQAAFAILAELRDEQKNLLEQLN